MARLVILIGILLLAILPAGASNAVSLGYSDETTIVGPDDVSAPRVRSIYNHDGSFENGYAWQYAGCHRRTTARSVKRYDLGAGTVRCGAYWLTTLPGGWWDQVIDCYVWQGGVGQAPGAGRRGRVGRVVHEHPLLACGRSERRRDEHRPCAAPSPSATGATARDRSPCTSAPPTRTAPAATRGPASHPGIGLSNGLAASIGRLAQRAFAGLRRLLRSGRDAGRERDLGRPEDAVPLRRLPWLDWRS